MVHAPTLRPLMEAAYSRGWLTRAAREKTMVLVETGLHPEQVLIGCGLLSATQYAELAQEVWHVRMERLDLDAFHVMERQTFGVGAEQEDGTRVWLSSTPWNVPTTIPEGHALRFVFEADIQRLTRSQEAVDLATSEWLDALESLQQTEFRLGVEGGIGAVWHGPRDQHDERLTVAREEIPALQVWMEYGYPSRDWNVDREPGLESHWVEAVAKRARHPLTQLHTWQEVQAHPKGVLLVIDPDAWLEHALRPMPKADTHQVLFAETDAWVRVHPATEAEREGAMHAALAGAPICWVEEHPSGLSYGRALASLGIAVTVVRQRHTVHGSAWEAYHFAV